MIEFSLSIDLGKKERNNPDADVRTPVDREFIARVLQSVAAEILSDDKPVRAAIVDETGYQVGSWKLGLGGFYPSAAG
jgi:hypothetical protein